MSPELRALLLRLAAAARDRSGMPPDLAEEVRRAIQGAPRGRPPRVAGWPPDPEARAALLRLLLITRRGLAREAANIEAGIALNLDAATVGKYAKRRAGWAELALAAWEAGALDLVCVDEEAAVIQRAMASVIAAFDKVPINPGE